MTEEQLRVAAGRRSCSESPNSKLRNVDLPAEVSPTKIRVLAQSEKTSREKQNCRIIHQDIGVNRVHYFMIIEDNEKLR